MFIRNENFYTFRRNYPIITILVAIHFILYIWMNFLPGRQFIYGMGVGYNPAVAAGEYWRLLTPIFLHIGLGHFVFNSFSLVIFGPALERMLGRIRFLFVYLISGVAANIATFYIGGLTYPQHLGASGAIFGLLGVYVYMVVYRKDLIDKTNAQLVMTILAIGLVMTFINSNINIVAHLFGLIAGAALTPMILSGVKPYSRPIVIRQQKDVAFNPNRWSNKRRNKIPTKKIVWTLFAILVISGLIARFF